MADQNSRGFRKFMLDPKSSVMTYIADNIPPDHLSHQQGSNGRPQNGPVNNSQQPNIQGPNPLQQNQILSQNPQNQSQDGFMRPPLPSRPSQSNSPSSSPRPGYARPAQSSQMPMDTPYIASNISQASQGQNGYPGVQSQIPGSQSMSNLSMAQESMSQEGPQSKYPSIQNSSPSIGTIGQGPPQPGARQRNSPQSAPRLYHRMVLEYEITKQAFFAAKSQHNTQEMASTAYELESSSRRLWGLRYEHSWEFEGYSESGHQAVYSKWQAEYETWADTILDIQDGQILADAANHSKYGNTSIHRDADGWDSQSRQARPGFQDLNGENRNQNPAIAQEQMAPQTPQQIPPQQQMPQLQHLSMDHPMPPVQALQNSQPPQPMPPGSFPQGGPPPTFSDQNMPPQQRQQSPQPPQMAMGQSLAPNLQDGPSAQPNQYNGPPNMQEIPPYGSAPNMQQQQPNMPGPNMQQPITQQPKMRPGQTPPPPILPQAQPRPQQQYPQQTQVMPSNTLPNMPPQQQQNTGLSQQQGPPRNGMMTQGPNMSPRPPRPGSQMPAVLQAGGQMSGNGNWNGRQ